MKGSDLARLTAVDDKTASLARDAARTFSGIDTRGIASVAETLRGIHTTKLVNVSAMHEAAKAFESMRPIVAPQIAPEIAEALKGMNAGNASIAETFKRMEPPTFRFARTLDDLKIASQFQPRLAEAFKAWEISPAFSTAVAEALRGIPRTATANLAPKAGEAVREAVILADTSTAAEVVDEMLIELDELSPSDRRELQKDVVDAIAALGTLVAIFARDGQLELASATLAFVAILISIYWRVTGRLDNPRS